MNKREIRKVPVDSVSKSGRGDFVISCKKLNGCLLLNIFRKGETCYPRAGLRVFIYKDDYITQDLSGAKPKWLSGRIDSVAGVGYYQKEKYVFETAEDEEAYKERFGEFEEDRWWIPLLGWQSKILDARRKERHLKELRHTREMMQLIPEEMPEDWDEWLKEFALDEFHFMVYVPSSKKQTDGFCTFCQQSVTLDQSAGRIKRGAKVKCPSCGKVHQAMPKSAQLNGRRYWDNCRLIDESREKWVALFQKIEGGFVVRYFDEFVRYNAHKKLISKPEYYESELCRVVCIDGKCESFEKRIYKQDMETWCSDIGKHDNGRALVYLNNLSEVIKGTIYQYCSLDLYQKAFGNQQIGVYFYMKKYPNNLFLEYLLKMGAVQLVDDLCSYSYYASGAINGEGKNPSEILKIDNRHLLKTALASNPSLDELRLYQTCDKCGYTLKIEDIKAWAKLLGNDDETLTMILDSKVVSVSKFLKYIESNVTSGISASSTVRDWKDYINIVADLKLYDLGDAYYYLPKNLRAAHDKVVKEKQLRKEQRAKELEREADNLMKKLVRTGKYEMSYKGLMMVVPKGAEDIKREGSIQHHCVGGYVERVAKGETMILFIRKQEAPEKPYFTVEYKNGAVVQCRGHRNVDPPRKVKSFVMAWEKRMKKAGTGYEQVKD